MQANEYPAQIASKFEITLDELLEFNSWELNDQVWCPTSRRPAR